MNDKTRRDVDAIDSGPARISRRTVAAGAAWSIPAVVLAAPAASAATTGVTFGAPTGTTTLQWDQSRTATNVPTILPVTQTGSVPLGVDVTATLPTASGYSVAATPTGSSAASFAITLTYTKNATKPAKQAYPLVVTCTRTSGPSGGPWQYTSDIVFN